MNEYIILHDGLDKEIKRLIKVSTILSWKPNKLGTGHVASVLNLKPKEDKIDYLYRIHESPAEIEALIMGRNESNWMQCLQGMDKEISDADAAYERLERECKILQEENAKLKDEVKSLTENNCFLRNMIQINPYMDSNPANRCCRETFAQLARLNIEKEMGNHNSNQFKGEHILQNDSSKEKNYAKIEKHPVMCGCVIEAISFGETVYRNLLNTCEIHSEDKLKKEDKNV